MNQVPQFATPDVPLEWSASRATHPAVAMAIHAIAGPDRPPEEIWELPTYTEWGCVTSAVENYIACGLFAAEPRGRYPWGGEAIVLPGAVKKRLYEVSANGTFFGTYQGATEQDARDACARDAGYESETDMVERLEQPSALIAKPLDALCKFVERCDGDAGVRADGSNIDTLAAHVALDALRERVAACARYADELDRIEVPPNGDDFNALLELLAGKPYRPPSAKGR